MSEYTDQKENGDITVEPLYINTSVITNNVVTLVRYQDGLKVTATSGVEVHYNKADLLREKEQLEVAAARLDSVNDMIAEIEQNETPVPVDEMGEPL